LGGVVHAVHVLAVAFRTERSLHTATHWSRDVAVVTFPVVKVTTLEPTAGVGLSGANADALALAVGRVHARVKRAAAPGPITAGATGIAAAAAAARAAIA